MVDLQELDDLESQIEALDQSLGGATQMAASFNAEMERVRGTFSTTGQDVASLDKGISRGLSSAIRGAGGGW